MRLQVGGGATQKKGAGEQSKGQTVCKRGQNHSFLASQQMSPHTCTAPTEETHMCACTLGWVYTHACMHTPTLVNATNMCMHTCTHTHACTGACPHTCICIPAFTHMHWYTPTYMHMHTCTHTHAHTDLLSCAHTVCPVWTPSGASCHINLTLPG